MTDHITVTRQGTVFDIAVDGRPLVGLVVNAVRLIDDADHETPRLELILSAARITMDACVNEIEDDDDGETESEAAQDIAG